MKTNGEVEDGCGQAKTTTGDEYVNGDGQKNQRKKKNKIKQYHGLKLHFAARKLHEEAAVNSVQHTCSGNGLNKSRGKKLLDMSLNKSDSLGKINTYFPCDHPGQPCNESCICVRNGRQPFWERLIYFKVIYYRFLSF